MKIFCCPVCMGRCDVPFGFYVSDVTLTEFDFYSNTQNITFESQKTAKPQQCKTCDGKGFIVIE